jgi:hypothetical protein
MEVTVVARSYCAELTVEQFVAIEALDAVHEEKNAATLCDLLGAMGAQHIEYNGLFGAAVFFTLPDDLQHRFADVILMISGYIQIAKEKGYIECH